MTFNLGERLRSLRQARGLTTQQLADKVAVSQSYISRFENNRAVPDIELLGKILHALDSDLASFFSLDEEEATPDLIQLIETIKTLTPEARIKLNEFIQLVQKG
ncbi:MAG: helix-turn-helix transcriptional regulator [Bacilli bacterium]|jgi:Predicted transcription factor, homolog of eukaryotic MBF1|nr:helix-turn-helix transcriptional regulator [Bacilli bacterium]